MTKPRRALLSVSDKTGIEQLGKTLVERGWQLLSTGGTAAALREAGLAVTDVAEITGHPEMMEGRVKTLHPAVHAGLLARRERAEDMQALEAQGYGPIDLVVVNLYPFRETVAAGNVPVPKAMEKVDVGGPTMIRAAAKNHRSVWVVVDPADYGRVLEALDGAGDGEALRRELAAKVFRHASVYDGAIADYLDREGGAAAGEEATGGAELGERFALSLRRKQPLRYGENPDQKAAFYWYPGEPMGLAGLEQLHGKELSYNNYLDLDGALLTLAPFAFTARAAVGIIKHTTPCGLAVGKTLLEAYRKALRTDPVSAFGSVIASNRPIDRATAEALGELFVECLVAPAFEPEALQVLQKKKNLRLLTLPGIEGRVEGEPKDGAWSRLSDGERAAGRFLAGHGLRPLAFTYRSVYGGLLVQSPPAPPFYEGGGVEWKVVTRRPPDEREADDLRFAWAAAFGVKSNAIVIAKDGATLGIGAGQMSRVDSSRIAVQKAADAKLPLTGAVLASDAFFPFRDGVDAAAAAGVTAIIQPGGSVRDEEVIDAANEHRIAMVFTGRRLFRH
jgi:phosphoribosylaminoimidazolecarboxamide formyltransferase/IMP cyclohydrolase